MEAGFVALGLVQGALAAFNALGLVLLWRTTKVINLAQPALGLVGGVLTGMLVADKGWSFWWAAPVGIVISSVLGFGSERLVMARLARHARTVSLVATIGLAALLQAMQSGLPFAFGGRLPSYDVNVGFEVFIFPVLLKGPHLLALFALPIAFGGLAWFLYRTRIGVASAAAGEDLERAQALGISPAFVRSISWTVAGTLSGVAGVLSIPVLGFSLGDGVAPTVLLLSLAPAVLAGMRSFGVAVIASLTVGVAYQFALVRAPDAGSADVVVAAVIVGALILRRRPLERDARIARAPSWAAAATTPPLPLRVRSHHGWRALSWSGAIALVAAAGLTPIWLSPANDVLYGTGAALALCAVAVATAWMFAGSAALGFWGIAALGASAVLATPGPVFVGVAAAAGVGISAGLLLTLVGRRRGPLAAAVAGLALAVAAPWWLLHQGAPRLRVAPEASASMAAVIAAVAAVGVTVLRARRTGVRMVAARDEERTARALGVRTVAANAAGMALAGGLAAVSGVLYLASVPAGLPPGAFDAGRSLDVLAFAVVGGLGSAISAGAAAAALILAGVWLPAPWDVVARGAGLLWVVLFAPGGLGSAFARARNWIAGKVVGASSVGSPPAAADLVVGDPRHDDAELVTTPAFAHAETPESKKVVAGADTRDALATPTVRAALVASFCLSAPAWAGLFGAPKALSDHLGWRVGAFAPWLVLALGAAAVGAGILRWRTWSERHGARSIAPLAGGAALSLAAFVITGDTTLSAGFAAAGAVGAVWIVVGLGRLAASASIARTRPAALGLIATAATAGLIGGAHIATVASGNTILAAAKWSVVYMTGGALAAAVAASRAGRDRMRARERDRPVVTTGRRRWAPLRVESLAVDFGSTRVLAGASFEVAAGEIVAVVGANGAGKSTLLRAIAGLTPTSFGRIDAGGEEITALRADERAAAGVAFVTGANPVFADLTVLQNLRAAAYLTHRTRAAFARALPHVIALVPRLDQRRSTRAGLLSGGEQRSLAIAQTLFRRPTLLLADELSLGLDRNARGRVFELMRALADDGVGVLVVDHDLPSLRAFADRALVVHEGEVETMSTAELAHARAGPLRARFLERSAAIQK